MAMSMGMHLGTWNICNAGKTFYRAGSHDIVEYLLHLENEQQIMPNNMETHHKHMYRYLLYIDDLSRLCNALPAM